MPAKIKNTLPPCRRQNPADAVSPWTSQAAAALTRKICATYADERGVNHLDGRNMPQSEEIIRILHHLLEILFPGYTGRDPVDRAGLEFTIGQHLNRVFHALTDQIERAFVYQCTLTRCTTGGCRRLAADTTLHLLEQLPKLREILKTDVQAAMDGDPAAKSQDEVIIAYPGLKAIAIQRLAHLLYQAEVPLISRVMGEYAHAITGIDIHPGAAIGHSLFIDHGTGVVIGETAVLGNQVKIYQGVTLGALSFPKDERGNIIKGAKRHPNLEDNVTIYAGATILGNITVGHDSVIGGNVWLTEAVPPHSRVTMAQPDLSIQTRSAAAKPGKPPRARK
jgi:serine O-acetyltransferase